MKKFKSLLFYTIPLAFMLFFITFYLNPYNFWVEISISTFLLASIALLTDPEKLKASRIRSRHIWIGISSAIGLYFIFKVGAWIAIMIFPFAGEQISSIYLKSNTLPLPFVGTLLFLVVAPCEEIYWRGTLQKAFMKRWGETLGFMITTLIYGLVHIWSLNFILVIAALTAGTFWGWIYKGEKSIYPVIISHALWNLLIFVIFPVK